MDCLCTLEALVGVTPFYNGINHWLLKGDKQLKEQVGSPEDYVAKVEQCWRVGIKFL
jgi:hypothetical protein